MLGQSKQRWSGMTGQKIKRWGGQLLLSSGGFPFFSLFFLYPVECFARHLVPWSIPVMFATAGLGNATERGKRGGSQDLAGGTSPSVILNRQGVNSYEMERTQKEKRERERQRRGERVAATCTPRTPHTTHHAHRSYHPTTLIVPAHTPYQPQPHETHTFTRTPAHG